MMTFFVIDSGSNFGPRDINTEMVTKLVPVRAVNFSIRPFCTEFQCEQLRDDDIFEIGVGKLHRSGIVQGEVRYCTRGVPVQKGNFVTIQLFLRGPIWRFKETSVQTLPPSSVQFQSGVIFRPQSQKCHCHEFVRTEILCRMVRSRNFQLSRLLFL